MRQDFDEYIGTAPASAIDIDGIARRGQRVRKRRSIAVGAAALAMVAAGSFGVAQLQRGAHGSPAPADLHPAASATSTDKPMKISTAFTRAITKNAPQVRFVKPLVWVPTLAMYQGTVTSPTGTYTVQAGIGLGAYIDPSAPPVDEMDAKERRIAAQMGEVLERGPNGENILAYGYMINMTKPDGTAIFIRAFDTNTSGAYMTRSPFTRAQLIAISLEPDLDLCGPTESPCTNHLTRD